jgi:membrane-associated HD superfamily phosphohydrolase
VPDGAALAVKFGLPTEIVDFIMTHHGTSRVEFFYRKYLKKNPEAGSEVEAEFRYPGPKPNTKEQAILMIADSVEAASRAMDSHSKESLTALVENIVSAKMADGQLDHARITFRDLSIIKREVLRLLLSIYHARIKYPDAPVPNLAKANEVN